MNRSFFSKTKYMFGVGSKTNWLAHPYQSYPQATPPHPRGGWVDKEKGRDRDTGEQIYKITVLYYLLTLNCE